MFSINNCESERKFIQNFNNKLSYEATTFTSCAMFWIKERVKELTIREHNFDNEDSFIPVSSTKKVDEVVVCIVDMANQACFFLLKTMIGLICTKICMMKFSTSQIVLVLYRDS